MLMTAVAVVGSNSLALSPILADVARDLGAAPTAVARASAAYGGGTALSALTLARLVDRIGAERALAIGLAALALALLGSAAAVSWPTLALAQAAAGGAAGIILPATYALATAGPPERQAATLGRVLTGWAVSLVAGVPLAALVAELASWRASYVALAALLVPLLLGIGWAPARSGAGSRDAPSLRSALMRPGILPLLVVCLLFMTAFYGVYAYLGDHARRALDLDAARAGLIALAYGIGFGLGMLADPFIDRVGVARLFPPTLVAMALIYAALIPGAETFPTLLTLAASWGLVNHVGLTILVARLSRAGGAAVGTVLALNSAVSYLGALLGAGLFGLLYDAAGFAALAGAAALLLAAAAAVAMAGSTSFRRRTAPGPIS
ncbi:MAG: MFS transporter [Methylobacteriaceae bacterium]|nr:MFS transporter [Methylobacteriaceae bacterium]